MKKLLAFAVVLLLASCASEPPRAIVVKPRPVETQRLSKAADAVFTSSENVNRKIDAVTKTVVDIEDSVARVSDKSKELSEAMGKVRLLAVAETELTEALDAQEEIAAELAAENGILKDHVVRLAAESKDLKETGEGQRLVIQGLYSEIESVRDQAEKAAAESEVLSIALTDTVNASIGKDYKIAELEGDVSWWKVRALALAGACILRLLFIFRKPLGAVFGIPLP